MKNIVAMSHLLIVAASCLIGSAPVLAEPTAARITTIYDAFGKPSALGRGWGYSALVEYKGKRILFDTGGQYQMFADNVKALGIDLSHLDFVVLSHRHGDHTSGLAYVLQLNPKVKIYAPRELGSFGTFGASKTSPPPALALASRAVNVPKDLRYFEGDHSTTHPIDSPWPAANITVIDEPIEVMPGFHLFKLVSDAKNFMELNELTLAIDTPKGLAIMVGCSHPGIERILETATKINPKIYTILGGMHLMDKADTQVTSVVESFKSKWNIERIAAGHCTGEFAQFELGRVFGRQHDHSGLGESIPLPAPPAHQ